MNTIKNVTGIFIFLFATALPAQSSEVEQLKEMNEELMHQNQLLLEKIEELLSNKSNPDSSPATSSQSTTSDYSPGLLLYVLDENGGQMFPDDPPILDRLSPPFMYNAHIRTNPRLSKYDIGALYWVGYINLEQTGEYLVETSMKVLGKLRSLSCANRANIDGIDVGDGNPITKVRKNALFEEKSVVSQRIKSASPGLRKFTVSFRCKPTKSGAFLEASDYQSLQLDMKILEPDSSNYRPLTSDDLFYKN